MSKTRRHCLGNRNNRASPFSFFLYETNKKHYARHCSNGEHSNTYIRVARIVLRYNNRKYFKLLWCRKPSSLRDTNDNNCTNRNDWCCVLPTRESGVIRFLFKKVDGLLPSPHPPTRTPMRSSFLTSLSLRDYYLSLWYDINYPLASQLMSWEPPTFTAQSCA